MPGIGLGQPGAQRRPHDRAHHHAHAPDRHRLGALMQRIGVQHHRLRQRHQGGAEHALQQAEQHHLVDVLRHPAHHRGDGEAARAQDEDALAAEAVGDPAHRRGHDRGGDDVGGQHPVDLVLRRRQAALHIGQRDIGDGGVQRLHDGRGHGADRHHVPAQAGNGERALRPSCSCVGLVLVRRRRRQAEQGGERTAMAGVDGGIGAHAGLQLADVFVIAVEIDSHRHPLHHLDEVAGGVLRRQDRELRAGAGAERTDGALEGMIRETHRRRCRPVVPPRHG